MRGHPASRGAGENHAEQTHPLDQDTLHERRGQQRQPVHRPADRREYGIPDGLYPHPCDSTTSPRRCFKWSGAQGNHDKVRVASVSPSSGVAEQGRGRRPHGRRVLTCDKIFCQGPRKVAPSWRPQSALPGRLGTDGPRTGATTLASEVQRLHVVDPDVGFSCSYRRRTTVFQRRRKRRLEPKVVATSKRRLLRQTCSRSRRRPMAGWGILGPRSHGHRPRHDRPSWKSQRDLQEVKPRQKMGELAMREITACSGWPTRSRERSRWIRRREPMAAAETNMSPSQSHRLQGRPASTRNNRTSGGRAWVTQIG